MRMKWIALYVFLIPVIFLISLYLNYDVTTCEVEGAHEKDINGYYSAIDGLYVKRGYEISTTPDFFAIYGLRRDKSSSAVISMGENGEWGIYIGKNFNLVYRNSPEHPENYIYNPPASGWKAKSKNMSTLLVHNCYGSLVSYISYIYIVILLL